MVAAKKMLPKKGAHQVTITFASPHFKYCTAVRLLKMDDELNDDVPQFVSLT